MATTIDHLRVGHQVTIRKSFDDANGNSMSQGDCGEICLLAFDQLKLEIQIDVELEERRICLRFPLHNSSGPRIRHMQDYFAVAEPALGQPMTETQPSTTTVEHAVTAPMTSERQWSSVPLHPSLTITLKECGYFEQRATKLGPAMRSTSP